MGQLLACEERPRPRLREAEEIVGGALAQGQCSRSGWNCLVVHPESSLAFYSRVADPAYPLAQGKWLSNFLLFLRMKKESKPTTS